MNNRVYAFAYARFIYYMGIYMTKNIVNIRKMPNRLKCLVSMMLGACTSLRREANMYCVDWFKKNIEIYDDGIDAVETAGEMTAYAADIVRILGIFLFIGCTLKLGKDFLQESPSAVSVAGWGIAISIVFIFMPDLIVKIF